MKREMKNILRQYDIVNGANDGLATINATSAERALDYWRSKLYHRHLGARGLRAVLRRDPRTNAPIRADSPDAIAHCPEAL
jgi:hypothetical protein